MKTKNGGIFAIIFAALASIGCDQDLGNTSPRKPTITQEIEQNDFKPSTIEDIGKVEVTDSEGKNVPLSSYFGQRNTVLVISRGYVVGYGGGICPYCNAQVQQLASKYSELENLNAQVIVVFPVSDSSDSKHSQELESSALAGLEGMSKLPFPILVDLKLVAVDQLGIRDQLAKPSTYIIDTEGKVRYSYIGRDRADRPTIPVLIKQLKLL